MWPDKAREVWFSLRENHVNAGGFGLHQFRNCFGVTYQQSGINGNDKDAESGDDEASVTRSSVLTGRGRGADVLTAGLWMRLERFDLEGL